MNKPLASTFAANSVAAVDEGISYQRMDCQDFVEEMVRRSGGSLSVAGSNDMARNAVHGLQALVKSKLMPGDLLFIREDGGEPAKYQTDGLGNFSHVGIYVGERALTDTDKNGKLRTCNVVHSSSTMGRVAGSTTENAWTHMAKLDCLTYGGESANDAAQNANDAAKNVNASVKTEMDVSGYYTVKRGCLGGAVRRLQTWLGDLGYDLGGYGADGDFGAATDAAVRMYQRDAGLTVDGIVGQKTWAALARSREEALNAHEG